MMNLWRPNTGFQIYDIANNLFLAAFSKPGEKECIVNNGQWTFGNSLVILSDYDGSLQILKVPMSFASFWVRIYDFLWMG